MSLKSFDLRDKEILKSLEQTVEGLHGELQLYRRIATLDGSLWRGREPRTKEDAERRGTYEDALARRRGALVDGFMIGKVGIDAEYSRAIPSLHARWCYRRCAFRSWSRLRKRDNCRLGTTPKHTPG